MLNRRVLSLVLVLLPFACSKSEPPPAPPAETVASTATTQTASTAQTTATAATASSAAPAPPAAPPTGAIATADGETDGVTVAVKELKRSSGGTVSLKFTITNGSTKDLDTGYAFVDRDHEVKDFNTVGGVQLIDPVGKKKYFVARDSDGKCVCSQSVKDIKAGTSVNVWAKFPAPPDDVEKISVVIPHFGPMDDVPISK